MPHSFQKKVSFSRINLIPGMHTSGAQKKAELPLNLMVVGAGSNGTEPQPSPEMDKVNISKNNTMVEYSPSGNLRVANTLTGNGNEENINLTFARLKDFKPQQVTCNIPQLRELLAMRNLLRDLTSNVPAGR